MSAFQAPSHVANGVYIGGTGLFRSVEALRQAGITHILKLYPDEPHWPIDFVVCEHPIEDGVFLGRSDLERGVAFIRSAAEADSKVLVACGLGISRSATFVLAYLLDRGYDLRNAFDLLRSARPQAWPARALWHSLIVHYGLSYSLDEVQGWCRLTRWVTEALA